MTYPEGNSITRNTFKNNTIQASLPQQIVGGAQADKNNWDDGSRGNYWSHYLGADADGDGVGDAPYEITIKIHREGEPETVTVAKDRFPLTHPFSLT
jgi:nitrous oxidase accessory protein NosD